jgi:acetyl esterase/lipase
MSVKINNSAAFARIVWSIASGFGLFVDPPRLTEMMERTQRLVVRIWPLLLSLAVLIGTPFALNQTKYGRTAVHAGLFLQDMLLLQPLESALGFDLPYRPIDLFSDAPSRERITIEYESRDGPRSIEADLYVPAGGGRHPGVVFSMGAPPLELDNKRLRRVAEDSARAGAVMLVPFSERLDDHEILPEEIDALVAEFEYLTSHPSVDPDRVGFFGASVGGSLALVAAGDPRIADDVDHVVSFGGYYDALEAFGAIATHRIKYEDVDEEWIPRRHSAVVMSEQIIWAVEDADDRELLSRIFLDRENYTSEELATLTPVGRSSYDFLINEDVDVADELAKRLPAESVAELDYLSPRTSIDRVQAELFIVHDVADPFIPYTESRKLRDHLRGRDEPLLHFDELRLFEHVEPKVNQRPDVIARDSMRLVFRLYQLLSLWD